MGLHNEFSLPYKRLIICLILVCRAFLNVFRYIRLLLTVSNDDNNAYNDSNNTKIIMIIIIILIITIIGFSSGHCTQWLFSVHSFQINLEFGSWFFCGGGKTGGLGENLGVRSRTNT